MKYRIFIIIGFVCLLFSGYGIPAVPVAADSVITAASGSASDIQAAADAVYAAGGGTVYIPEGDFNLGGSVLIRDRVSLIGAGMNNTILRTRGESMVIRAEGDNIRISGFSLISATKDGKFGVWVQDCVDFRVDHLYTQDYYQAGVRSRGADTRGVIDHCSFKPLVGGLAAGTGYGVSVSRQDNWEEDMKLGTKYATFIEDCQFVNARHAVCGISGAHYVFRHNHCYNGVTSFQADAHGQVDEWNWEGTRCVEIYNNVIENPVSGEYSAVGIRGGDGVIFNNYVRGYDYVVKMVLEYTMELAPYPMYHQVRDMWIWNNNHDGIAEATVGSSYTNFRSRDYIIKGRDYFLEPKPGYTPYTYPHPLVEETVVEDSAPPYTSRWAPAKGATDVNPNTDIVVHVQDDGDGVDWRSIDMTVEGITVTPTITGSPSNYTLKYEPSADFSLGQVVNVTVDAQDLAVSPNTMIQDAYSFTITVNEAGTNSPPVLGSIGNKTVTEGQSLQFTVSANDPDNDSLTYSASNLPEGASFDPRTRTFSWTSRYDQAGVYSVQFEVSDGQLTDSEDITITVFQLSEDWDINGDDDTNILDMVLVGQHWGESGLTGWIREDANEDGTISVLDMIVIGQHWTT